MDNSKRIEVVRKALDLGQVRKVEFMSDGSGADFWYIHPTANHGCPCEMLSHFNAEDTMKIIQGYRFTQHELRRCI